LKQRWGFKLWIHPIYATLPNIKEAVNDEHKDILEPLYYETISMTIYLGAIFSRCYLYGHSEELPKEPSVTSWYIFKSGLNKEILNPLFKHPMIEYLASMNDSQSILSQVYTRIRSKIPYPL